MNNINVNILLWQHGICLIDVKLGRRVANGLCDYGAVWTGEVLDIVDRNFANFTLGASTRAFLSQKRDSTTLT